MGERKNWCKQSVNLYKPWIFYHLRPTLFVWSWTQATWLPKTRSSGKMRLLNFSKNYDPKLGTSHTISSEMVWFQVWIWHTFHMFPMCSKKIHQVGFLVIEIPASPSLFSTTWQEKLASVQFITLDLCRLRRCWWVYCLLFDVYTCSLQPLGLPAANPAYPLTCSSPFAGSKFFIFQNPLNLKP